MKCNIFVRKRKASVCKDLYIKVLSSNIFPKWIGEIRFCNRQQFDGFFEKICHLNWKNTPTLALKLQLCLHPRKSLFWSI